MPLGFSLRYTLWSRSFSSSHLKLAFAWNFRIFGALHSIYFVMELSITQLEWKLIHRAFHTTFD